MKLIKRLFHFTTAMMKSNLIQTEKEVTINAPWGKIAALSWGDPSNPPVLLCHGKLDACSGFRPLISRLPPSFFYLSIDLPGNGLSDHLPKGIRYSVIDLVSTIVKVKNHFGWDKFIYIGHSLGVPIGKYFNMAYPGHITRMVELDPIPAHHTWPTTREGIREWFHTYYQMYDDEKYHKYNGGKDTAPKYTYKKAQELLMKTRLLKEESTKHVLERCLLPAGDGLYTFTFDQRMKDVTVLPFSSEILRQLYTTTKTPTLCILAKTMVEQSLYDAVPFVKDTSEWPYINYKVKIVEGGHDVHIDDPDSMSDDISQFLLEEIKEQSKL